MYKLGMTKNINVMPSIVATSKINEIFCTIVAMNTMITCIESTIKFSVIADRFFSSEPGTPIVDMSSSCVAASY